MGRDSSPCAHFPLCKRRGSHCTLSLLKPVTVWPLLKQCQVSRNFLPIPISSLSDFRCRYCFICSINCGGWLNLMIYCIIPSFIQQSAFVLLGAHIQWWEGNSCLDKEVTLLYMSSYPFLLLTHHIAVTTIWSVDKLINSLAKVLRTHAVRSVENHRNRT